MTPQTLESLLPCPHCGSKAELGVRHDGGIIQCTNCLAEHGDIAEWNTRVSPDMDKLRNEILERLGNFRNDYYRAVTISKTARDIHYACVNSCYEIINETFDKHLAGGDYPKYFPEAFVFDAAKRTHQENVDDINNALAAIGKTKEHGVGDGSARAAVSKPIAAGVGMGAYEVSQRVKEPTPQPNIKTSPFLKCLMCDAEAAVVIHALDGCTCSANKYQPRCAHHLARANDTNEDFEIVEDFRVRDKRGAENATGAQEKVAGRTTPQPDDSQACRRAFGKWAKDWDKTWYMDGDEYKYFHSGTEASWRGFQAAWNLKSKPTQSPIDDSEACRDDEIDEYTDGLALYIARKVGVLNYGQAVAAAKAALFFTNSKPTQSVDEEN